MRKRKLKEPAAFALIYMLHEGEINLRVMWEVLASKHVRVIGEPAPALKRYLHTDLIDTEFGKELIKATEELGLEGYQRK
jgi:hypothetical protein